MQFALPVILFLLCAAQPLSAQELRTNAEGEKIIVYADGTARYFNDLTLIEAQRRDSAAASYPVIAADIDPLARPVDPSDADLKRVAERKLTLAREALALAEERAAAARNNRLQLDTDLANARANNDFTTATELQRRLQLARQVEAKAIAERTNSEKRMAAAALVVREGSYVNAWNQARRIERYGPPVADEKRGEAGLRLLLPPEPRFSGYGPAPGREPQALSSPCKADQLTTVLTNGVRPLSYPLLLFSYTDENLRPFLEGKEYLNAYAEVGQSPAGDRVLKMRFNFSNPNAMTNYGFLEAGSSLAIELLNGRTITLRALERTEPFIDRARGEVNYRAQYALPRGVVQVLRSTAVDRLSVYWSGGFEEYPVYRVDVLQRLMECL